MELRSDCRHFPGDRPCRFHKKTGVTCSDCPHFAERGTGVLIVKLDALGDVLRTTSVLPSLHRTYDPCHVTWVTSGAAMDLFVGNAMVDEVLDVAGGALPMLLARDFDLVINPDASPRACAIATAARGKRKHGFVLSPEGHVKALGGAAREWLLMGSFDQVKRENRRTYQEILHEICGLDPAGQRIVLSLTEAERENQSYTGERPGPGGQGVVVGINAGAGERWEHKKWRMDGFIELIDMLLGETDAGVVLLGGPAERERNATIISHFGSRVKGSCHHNLRDFITAVNLCDVVLTGDTLALHVALGLEKRVVALFGPTSPHEVDLYGLGQKIVPALDCVCCYRTECDRRPSCMDLIDARDVFRAVSEEMARVRAAEMPEAQMVGEPGR